MAGAMRVAHRSYPKTVGIIYGAPQQLVDHRRCWGQKGKYETNRHIKYWSTWFLLKSLSSSSFIQDWTTQRKFILTWLQMGERTFVHQLDWLQSNKMLYRDAENPNSIRLISYEDAAQKLGIEYDGVYQVEYNPKNNKQAKQTFQYLLRTEEFEYRKQLQVDRIMSKLEVNPSLKKDLIYHLCQLGADYRKLVNEPAYFVRRLLALQMRLFKEGSELLDYIMQLRADINRGVIRIKNHHNYRSRQSVTYMKKQMFKYGYAVIIQRRVESEARSRLYVPPNEETPEKKIRKDGLREGYIWNPANKTTIWRLCDQVRRNYSIRDNIAHQKTSVHAA